MPRLLQSKSFDRVSERPDLPHCSPELRQTQGQTSPPARDTSGVDHIVVVMMENRSFDHLFGWHPTADAQNQELSYPDPDNGNVSADLAAVAPDFTGCGHPDPDHSWEGGAAAERGAHGWLPGGNQR